MTDLAYTHYASAAGGLILIVTICYTLIKHSPPPWRNTIFAGFAVCLFAFSTGSKFTFAYNKVEGVKLEVAELQKDLQETKKKLEVAQATITKVTEQQAKLADGVSKIFDSIGTFNPGEQKHNAELRGHILFVSPEKLDAIKKELRTIKKLNIYDFNNTKGEKGSPVPNK